MLKFIMENWKLVKIGTTQTQRKLFFNLAKERDKPISQGYDPEPRLLAERLDVKEKEIEEMSQRLGGGEVSLNAPVGEMERRCTVLSCLIPAPARMSSSSKSRTERYSCPRKLAEYRSKLSGKAIGYF